MLQNLQIRSRLKLIESGPDCVNLMSNARPIRLDHHYGQLSALQVLLILDVLVCREQQVIAFFFGQVQKFSVSERLPSEVFYEINRVSCQSLPQWHGSALVEQIFSMTKFLRHGSLH